MISELPNLSILSLLILCVSFLIIGGGVVVLGIILLSKRNKEIAEHSPVTVDGVYPAADQESENKSCPSCGTENPKENNFCEQCGATLGK